ncbi:acyl-CoA thioesterase [Hirschia baltica]|uniref:Thioesterase superfamily protein n=1 Tax=Hirschia baltica (strain ATCC 49814 / DSM 5838 / IFAM 1418) TaxID=582402 RepID=C6XIP1_HIRBI|nr:acyl-CoA thioesterase [Hirschia baltica]ACT58986.1 thioesterase superfamily protein [Hirschia baltica ATCC 49814]
MRRAIVKVETQSEAQFHDIDPMNIVWHGNYPRFFELGRVKLLDEIAYGYEEMKASGFAWPVIEMNIRYAHPIVLREKIIIVAGLTEWENRLKIDFEIRNKETNKRLCKAYTTHVAVDIKTNNMLWETPDVFRKKLEPFLK